MDKPTPPTEPEFQEPLQPKTGWMAGRDLELALAFAFVVEILVCLSPKYTGRDSTLSLPLQYAMGCIQIASVFGSLLFAFSGMRHEKGIARGLCAVIFCGWIILFLVVLRIAWH